MQGLEFRIQDHKDKHSPLFPEYGDKTVLRGDVVAVGFVEKGTTAGRPAVVALVKLDDETYVDFQMTANMYLTMAAGMKGAMERWGTPWDGA